MNLLMQFRNPRIQLFSGQADDSIGTTFGYLPKLEIASNLNDPPDPNNPSDRDAYYLKTLTEYQIRPANIDGLEEIVSQKEMGVQIAVVELPLHRRYFQFFGKHYQRFVNKTRSVSLAHDAFYLSSNSDLVLPDDGWLDEASHMNATGAKIFSHWLGYEIGKAVEEGILTLSQETISLRE